MTLTVKIILSLPSFLKFFYYITFIFPTAFVWLFPDMFSYNLQIGILHLLTLIQILILIQKLWSFKNIKPSIKKEWTWLLIIFASVSSLYFIWEKMAILDKMNKTKHNTSA